MYEILAPLTPIGIALDIIGFGLVIRYGHSLFIHISSSKPPDETGKDGDLFMVVGNGEADTQAKKRRILARAGVVVVIIGFILQFIGSFAN